MGQRAGRGVQVVAVQAVCQVAAAQARRVQLILAAAVGVVLVQGLEPMAVQVLSPCATLAPNA